MTRKQKLFTTTTRLINGQDPALGVHRSPGVYPFSRLSLGRCGGANYPHRPTARKDPGMAMQRKNACLYVSPGDAPFDILRRATCCQSTRYNLPCPSGQRCRVDRARDRVRHKRFGCCASTLACARNTQKMCTLVTASNVHSRARYALL